MDSPPIFLITGPPAAGKSTLAKALLRRFAFGLHLPVDDLRELVVSGMAHPIGWTDETTRQFALAEEGAADLACRYNDAGFAVAIDHCCPPGSLSALVENRFSGRRVLKVALLPGLEVSQHRNLTRQNKSFAPEILTETIDDVHRRYREAALEQRGWWVIENDEDDVEALVDQILSRASTL